MNIWKVESDYDNFCEVTFVDDDDWENIFEYSFHGESQKEKWIPFEVKIEKTNNKIKADIPPFGADTIVVNDKAKKIIEHIATDSIEILPFKCEEEAYSIINVLNVIDCLDLEKTKYKTLKTCNKIETIQEYHFIEEKLKGASLFKIDKFLIGKIYATDIFKEAIESNEITGLKFKKVWCSQKL